MIKNRKNKNKNKWQLKWSLLFLLFFPFFLLAKNEIRQVITYEKNKAYFVDIIAQIELTPNIELALHKGMQLVFNYEIIVREKNKWYWKNKTEFKKSYIVSYNQTINRFEISNPITFERKEFFDLKSLIHFMEYLSNFPLMDKDKLADKKPELKVRFTLDKNKLPSIIRIESLFKKDWDIHSDWTVWQPL